MKRKLLLALMVASFAMLGAQPSMAKSKHSCTEINKALHSGKSQEEVAKSMKVSPEVVRGCTQKHAKK